LQNWPLESSCVIVALIENYSTSKPLKASPEKSQILSCDTLIANEQFSLVLFHFYLDEGSAFGYYNFLPIPSYCVDTSFLQAAMCCVTVYWRHLVGTFIKLYHYIEKEAT